MPAGTGRGHLPTLSRCRRSHLVGASLFIKLISSLLTEVPLRCSQPGKVFPFHVSGCLVFSTYKFPRRPAPHFKLFVEKGRVQTSCSPYIDPQTGPKPFS